MIKIPKNRKKYCLIVGARYTPEYRVNNNNKDVINSNNHGKHSL